ncbi:MAG: DUF1501 domain-containing protein [Proteobacteria bacterium]|nr:DUF1501 domain-containing protein [Pseudomonadota bacterium]MBI3497117.1 DUF1501 domain-containing protein [Pseudomonadota bacterium]
MPMISRRRLLATGAASAAGLMLRPGLQVAFADTASAGDILVVLFLRGGADGLSLVAPVNDANYIAARPTLAVPASGANAGLALAGGPAGVDFRLHPWAAGLKALYDQGRLAIVHACGLPSASRSHFKSQDLMERGYGDGEAELIDGWITRHLAVTGIGSGAVPVMAAHDSLPISLLRNTSAVAIPAVQDFFLEDDDANRGVLQQLCAGTSDYAAVGSHAIAALGAVYDRAPKNAAGAIDTYHPAPGVDYGRGELADGLKTVAELVKLDVGLKLATVEFNNWDTHDDQAIHLQSQIGQLSQALSAFWADLASYQSRLTVVAMTEFGRRVAENANRGTDHGHGSVMLALGGPVNGGRIYGTWPGLAANQLDQRLDLAITTDYRQVLAEILVRRQGNPNIAAVFPTITYQPLGIVAAS